MPSHECPFCGANAYIPAWERIFRCPKCGEKDTLPVPKAPVTPPIPVPGKPPELETVRQEIPSDKIACPLCGMYVSPARVCSECASPLPQASA